MKISHLKFATREWLRRSTGRDPGTVYPRHFQSPLCGRICALSGKPGTPSGNSFIVHFVPGCAHLSTRTVTFMLN